MDSSTNNTLDAIFFHTVSAALPPPITPDHYSIRFAPPRRNRRVLNFQSRSMEERGQNGGREAEGAEGEAEGRRRLTDSMAECNGRNAGERKEVKENAEEEAEDIEKAEEKEQGQQQEEEGDEFWTGISALRNTKYGIAMWCIAWNGVALYAMGGRADRLLFNLLLGIGHIFSGWQTKRISKLRNFRALLPLLPTTLLFTLMALIVLQWNIAELFASIDFDFLNQSVAFDGRIEAIFAAGNCVLACFVGYCNLAVLRMICAKVGARLDSAESEMDGRKVLAEGEGGAEKGKL